MNNQRLKVLKDLIELTKHKSGHLIIRSRVPNMCFQRLTSITSNLSSFEQDCVRVWAYREITQNGATLQTARNIVGGANYAEVFGSPWPIEEYLARNKKRA